MNYTNFAISIDVEDNTYSAECIDKGVTLRQYGLTEDQACGNLLRLIIYKENSGESIEENP